ncbi:MAG: lipid-A-disaccharide synthase [Synergistaceae bacterium]|nr:lipid-A-disaccharide synthase [Synergistaceae bacterium]
MRIFFSSGEASGDHLAALLVKSLQEEIPGIECWGMGGPESRSAGMRADWSSESLQLMGIGEVVRSIPRLWRLKDEISRRIVLERPEAMVVVDSPDFHFPLLAQARRSGYRGTVIYLSPPQVWAWRSGRTGFLKSACDLCLPLFDFEHEFLLERGVPSAWVGHPFTDEFRSLQPLEEPEAGNRRVALLPGSRPGEIRRLLPVLLETSEHLGSRGFEPVFSIAPGLEPRERERLSSALEGRQTCTEKGRFLMERAFCVIGASGTAAVEAMMLDRFMIVLYRASLSSEIAFRLLVKTPHISIPNRLAGKRVYPELVQGEARASKILEHFEGYWAGGEGRKAVHEGLAKARARMGKQGVAGFWAREVLERAGAR